MSGTDSQFENKPLVLKLVLALYTTAGEKHAAHLGYFAGQAAATEKAAQIVLLDACDNPKCDMPTHERAHRRSGQILSLAPMSGIDEQFEKWAHS